MPGEGQRAGSGARPSGPQPRPARPDMGGPDMGGPGMGGPDVSGTGLLGPDLTGPQMTATAGDDQDATGNLLSAVAEMQRQRDEYLDALRRLQAEFDNYRKRIERAQRETVENAAVSLVKSLLPVLDTADLALAHGAGEDVKQVASALFDVLSKEGLERVDPVGQPFDPEDHDAVAHDPVEGEGAPVVPEVSEVMRAGYRWKGRALRPAMVRVRG